MPLEGRRGAGASRGRQPDRQHHLHLNRLPIDPAPVHVLHGTLSVDCVDIFDIGVASREQVDPLDRKVHRLCLAVEGEYLLHVILVDVSGQLGDADLGRLWWTGAALVRPGRARAGLESLRTPVVVARGPRARRRAVTADRAPPPPIVADRATPIANLGRRRGGDTSTARWFLFLHIDLGRLLWLCLLVCLLVGLLGPSW